MKKDFMKKICIVLAIMMVIPNLMLNVFAENIVSWQPNREIYTITGTESSYLKFPFRPKQTATISVSFKPDAMPQGAYNPNYDIGTQLLRVTDGVWYAERHIGFGNDGTIAARFYNGSSMVELKGGDNDPKAKVGEWINVTYTSIGSDVYLYINGKLVDKANGIIEQAWDRGEPYVVFGEINWGKERFKGQVSDILTKNDGASEDRAQELYLTSKAAPQRNRYVFDGTGQSLPKFDFKPGENYTIAASVKPEQLATSGILEAFNVQDAAGNHDRYVGIDKDGKIVSRTKNNLANVDMVANADAMIAIPNEWVHVSLTGDSNIVSLYVNGVLASRMDKPCDIQWGTDPVQLVLGDKSWGSEYFKGEMTDVEFTTSSSNEAEIKVIYDGSITAWYEAQKPQLPVEPDPVIVEPQSEYVWTPDKGMSAWKKIGGSGSAGIETLRVGPDLKNGGADLVREGMHLKGETVMLLDASSSMTNGEIEVTFDTLNDHGKVGFLFRGNESSWQRMRCTEANEWGWGFSHWWLENQTGTNSKYFHKDGDNMLSRNGAAQFVMKLRFEGTKLSLYKDNYLMYTRRMSDAEIKSGKVGFTTGSDCDVLVTKAVARTFNDTKGKKQTSTSQSITNGKLAVEMASDFPRVIEYVLNNKKMTGSDKKNNTVSINAVDYPATATIKSQQNNSITYNVVVEKVNVNFDIKYTVLENNILDMRITKINDENNFVYSLGFSNQPLFSVNSKNDMAKFDTTRLAISSNDKIIDEHFVLSQYGIPLETQLVNIAIASTGELSASMYNNVMNDWFEFKYRGFIEEDKSLTVGAWNTEFMYRGPDDKPTLMKKLNNGKNPGEGTVSTTVPEELYCQVAITEDANNDNTADWQDGAIALRKVTDGKINKGDLISDSMLHIAYNNVSHATNPFLSDLDSLKRFYNVSDGFGQILELKGVLTKGVEIDQYNYSVAYGGPEDMRKLTDMAKGINATVGIHMNHSEVYPEANAYNYDMASTYGAWYGLDTSRYIRREYDIMAGGLDERLTPALRKYYPNMEFAYIDTYRTTRWNMAKLMEIVYKENEMMVAPEGGEHLNRWSAWAHGATIPGDGMHRFIYNTQKDVYLNSNYYLGGDERGYGNGFLVYGYNFNNSVKQAFTDVMPRKYLANHAAIKIDEEAGIAYFEGGVQTTKNKQMYKVESGKKKLLSSPGLTLIPWFNTQGTQTGNPDDAAKLYHWNSKGGSSTWDLPDSWNGQKTVKIYATSQTGKELVEEVSVTADNKVTINAKANTAYVVYKGDETIVSVPVKWSEGSPIEDAEFNGRNIGDAECPWEAESTSGTTDHIYVKDDNNGFAQLVIKGEKDGKVSQTMTGLVPGEKYRAYVYAGTTTGKTARLKITTPDGKSVENYTENTPLPSKHAYSRWMNQPVQIMYVDFVQPMGATTAIIELSADASSSNGEALFSCTRVVKGAAATEMDLPKGHVVKEDFESPYADGFRIFVPGQGDDGTHITFRHDPYTNDVITGESSLQIKYNNTRVRSLPHTVRLKPNTKYVIKFKTMGRGDINVFSESDTNNIILSEYMDGKDTFEPERGKDNTMPVTERMYTIQTGNKNDYVIELVAKGNELIVDDFEVYENIEDNTPPTVPSNVKSSINELSQIKITWDASVEQESSVGYYNVYRDGTYIGKTNKTEFVDADINEKVNYKYQISAVNTTGTESEKSTEIIGYLEKDTTLPKTDSAKAIGSDSIIINFSEKLDKLSAEDMANYTISNGGKVLQAELLPDNKSVKLTVSNLTIDGPFIISISNVKDKSISKNVISPASAVEVSILIRYYKFDEDFQLAAVDSIGIENVAKTNVNIGAEVEGINNSALHFKQSRINLSNNSMQDVNEWTVATWIKDFGDDLSSTQYIASNAILGKPGFSIYIGTDGKLHADLFEADGSKKSITSSGIIESSEWTHIALSLGTNKVANLLVNGEVVGTAKISTYPNSVESNVSIGSKVVADNEVDFGFNGKMDDFKIFCAELQPQQVKTIVSNTAVADPYVSYNKIIVDANNIEDAKIHTDTNAYRLIEVSINGSILNELDYSYENSKLVIKSDKMAEFGSNNGQISLKFEKDSTIITKDVQLEWVGKSAVDGDKSDLTALIDYAKARQNDAEYTHVVPVVKAKLTEMIKAGETVIAKADALQAEVDKAYNDLLQIVHMLSYTGDSTNLRVTLDVAKGKDITLYTSDTAKALSDAIAAAEIVVANQNALQEEIDAANTALQVAIDGLVAKSIDKSNLQNKINEAKAIDLSKYLDAGKTEFTDALTVAQGVFDNPNATQSDVESAYNALRDAIFGLREIPNKSKLEELINAAKAIDLSKYTNSSSQMLRAALEKAVLVLENEQATTGDIDNATSQLSTAIANLELISTEEPSGNENVPVTSDTNMYTLIALLVMLGCCVVIRKIRKA